MASPQTAQRLAPILPVPEQRRPLVMAILNASPESFHAGSVAVGRDAVRRAAEQAEAQGADILDIGAMSTAPYKEARIGEQEEADRMGEAVAAARGATRLAISADTQRAAPARAALEAGADILNDVSGLARGPELARLAKAHGAGLVLMAAEEQIPADAPPRDPAPLAMDLLRGALARAQAEGVPGERIIVDPGIGFFRNTGRPWHEFDLALLRALRGFEALGFPVLVSASRKSFIGHLLDLPDPADRLAGSLAAAIWCVDAGASIIRTHDVAATRDAVRMWRLLRREVEEAR